MFSYATASTSTSASKTTTNIVDIREEHVYCVKINETIMYKSIFKDLKRKCPPPDYSSVLDFDKTDKCSEEVVKLPDLLDIEPNVEDDFLLTQLRPVREWEVYKLKEKPGLLFIKNPFNWIGQRYWICRCLQDFSQKPNRLNLDAHNELNPEEDWWESSQRKDQKRTGLQKKLRWATMGYHHDWNTKVYSEAARDPFPSDLAALSRFVARAIGFSEPFDAQAAIVNYYHLDSTLSGHTDHSEDHVTAPLLSFSFGQTAIFLLGGQSADDIPTPMYIRSGDIVIMSGCSRLSYHGIPKILKETSRPWEPETNISPPDPKPVVAGLNQNSLNQEKTENGSDTIEIESNRSPKSKKRKLKNDCRYDKVDCSNIDHLSNDGMWWPFGRYVESSRINMNVRQVLFAGQKALKSDGNSQVMESEKH